MSTVSSPDVEAQTIPRPQIQKQRCFRAVASFFSKCKTSRFWRGFSKAKVPTSHVQWIEDLPQGYPKFAALIGQDVAFQVSRRFSTARTRLLLKKQDAVLQLEQQLETLDKGEPRPLFLASFRRDRNAEREELLRDLDTALADYDALLERNARVNQLQTPNKRHTTSLSNWLTNTGSVCRKETSFLQEPDLCTVASHADEGLSQIEALIEILIVFFLSRMGIAPAPTISNDPNIFVFKSRGLRFTTRLLSIWVIIALLLVPVVVIRIIEDPALQIACILVASGCFVLTLSLVVNAKTKDIFIAGPTYAALLVVFVVGKGNES